jgi:hypothetical protein
MTDMRSLIVICLDDDKKYVQPSRRRFLTEGDAQDYADSLAPGRKALVVAVEACECENGRPVDGEPGRRAVSDPGLKARLAAEAAKWLGDPPAAPSDFENEWDKLEISARKSDDDEPIPF